MSKRKPEPVEEDAKHVLIDSELFIEFLAQFAKGIDKNINILMARDAIGLHIDENGLDMKDASHLGATLSLTAAVPLSESEH